MMPDGFVREIGSFVIETDPEEGIIKVSHNGAGYLGYFNEITPMSADFCMDGTWSDWNDASINMIEFANIIRLGVQLYREWNEAIDREIAAIREAE